MTLLSEYEQVTSEETCREAVGLVSRMMRYRVDLITGLEEEFHDLLQGIRAPGNRRKFRRSARRLILLANRIEQLARDTRYDAIHLNVILQLRQESAPGTPCGLEDDPVRYIN